MRKKEKKGEKRRKKEEEEVPLYNKIDLFVIVRTKKYFDPHITNNFSTLTTQTAPLTQVSDVDAVTDARWLGNQLILQS